MNAGARANGVDVCELSLRCWERVTRRTPRERRDYLDAKRADGMYEEEKDDEDDEDDDVYDENENINDALSGKDSFVPSDAETRSSLATKDDAIAVLLETSKRV